MFMHSIVTDETIRFGVHDDGTDASYVLNSHHSMWSGAIIGGTGSGYSHILDRLLSNRPDNTRVWYLDNGSMGPAAEAESDWVVSHRFADEMLDEASALIYRRKINQAARRTRFARSKKDPGVLIVIEESHQILTNGRLRRKVEDIAATSRKTGVAVLLVSSDPTVGYGSQVLHRATGHNTVVMNTGVGVRVPGVSRPLLPTRTGHGYLVRDDQATAFIGDF